MKLNTKDRVLKIALKVKDERLRELLLTPLNELSADEMMLIVRELKSKQYSEWYNENIVWDFEYGEQDPPIARFNLKDPK